jgi:hypothetical protein
MKKHRRTWPRFVSRITATGGLAAALLAAAAVGPAQAAPPRGAVPAITTCSSIWYTIEVGNNARHFVRPDSDLQNAVVYGNGTASEPWNNLFQLCRDPGWSPGDYGLRANLGGRYLKVNPATKDLIMADSGIVNTTNLLRIRNFDGNFQTLWSPSEGRYVGPTAPAGQLSARTTDANLNGSNLYKVRSDPPPQTIPPGIPCDSNGPLC